MGSEKYIQQILAYFRKNFIDETDRSTPDEFSLLIKEKLMLIDSEEERKSLVSKVMSEIQEILLVEKYKVLYQKSLNTNFYREGNYVINRLKYNFSHII